MEIDKEDEFSEWCCPDNFEGERDGLNVLARSRQEAGRRLYHIGHGRVHGELVGTFPASGPLTRVIGGVLVPADRLGTKREPASLRLLRTMIPIRDGNGGNVPVDNGGREGTADFQGPASASTGHSEGRTGYWSQDDPSRLLTSGRDRPAILRRRSGRFAVIRADRSGSRNPDRVNAPPHSSPF